MATAPNLTREERRNLEILRADAREAEKAPPPSAEFQAVMNSEAEASGALMLDSAAHDRVMNMPRDEFEAEFADVLNANAYDGDEGPPEAGPTDDEDAPETGPTGR